MTRIVLAYSGSPDSSPAIGRLAAAPRAEVVTLTLDLGQGRPLEAIRDRALALGAVRAHVLDAHEEFAREYVLRALSAGALFAGGGSLVTALSRPLIAQKLVEIAGIEQTTTVAHACAPGDARIEVAARALKPDIAVLAVPRDTGAPSPAASASAAEYPGEPASIELTFERGRPVAINEVAMGLLDLVGSLDLIAGAHGVGRFDGLETPAAAVLSAAYRAVGPAVDHDDLGRRYAEVIDAGAWFAPARQALDAEVAALQARVSGTVRLKLFKGGCDIVERRRAPARTLTLIA